MPCFCLESSLWSFSMALSQHIFLPLFHITFLLMTSIYFFNFTRLGAQSWGLSRGPCSGWVLQTCHKVCLQAPPPGHCQNSTSSQATPHSWWNADFQPLQHYTVQQRTFCDNEPFTTLADHLSVWNVCVSFFCLPEFQWWLIATLGSSSNTKYKIKLRVS